MFLDLLSGWLLLPVDPMGGRPAGGRGLSEPDPSAICFCGRGLQRSPLLASSLFLCSLFSPKTSFSSTSHRQHRNSSAGSSKASGKFTKTTFQSRWSATMLCEEKRGSHRFRKMEEVSRRWTLFLLQPSVCWVDLSCRCDMFS